MSRRKKTSGGQAIVLVTLALFSMAGMMGLAVDLGWSYFVQKTAQASADGAALAAVHEAWARKGGSGTAWSCGTGASATYCQANAPASCSTIQSDTASSLYHGCLYAINNGFNYTSGTSRQKVTVQADVGPSFGGTVPPTVPGIAPANIVYWVTVRTVQTIPQLFSSLLGNTQGTVAAIATAAAVNKILPGSFYGLNREGDCLTDGSKGQYDCGVNIDVKNSGSTHCLDVNGQDTGITGKVCAAGGIFMASGCNGIISTGCTDPGGKGTANFAGNTNNSATVWGGNVIAVRNAGAVTSDGNTAGDQKWLPAHTNSSNQSLFQDPMHTRAQPPLVATGTLGTCGILNGVLPDGQTLGAYQYYSYSVMANGLPVPDGKPITIGGGNTATFASGGGCPGVSSGSAMSGSFPDFVFYGGFVVNSGTGGGQSGNNTTVNFGSGQYVMAGTLNNTASSGCDGPCVFAATNGNINGSVNGSASQTMFIFTDANYPGLSSQAQALPNYNVSQIPNLVQGDVEVKNPNVTLTGITPGPSDTLHDYQNILFWQDRRNSTVTCTGDNGTSGCSPSTTTQLQANHVTDTSPRFIMGSGGGAMNFTGVLYQPRGAWFELDGGNQAAAGNLKLQLITGAITCVTTSGGCGSASVTLLSPTAPIIEFVTALIQ